MTSLLLLLACAGSGSGTDTMSACPGLDCQDAITLSVYDPGGTPTTWFEGNLLTEAAEEIEFSCGWTSSSFEGGVCEGEGRVTLYTYTPTLTGWMDAGAADGPSWSGTITPDWTAPYDSEACGHYCYLSEEDVTMEACDGCG